MRNIVQIIAVIMGSFLGLRFWGIPGYILGATVCFILVLSLFDFFTDQFKPGKNPVPEFLSRHKSDLINMISMIGCIAIALIYADGLGDILGGIIAGLLVGLIINSIIESSDEATVIRLFYLSALSKITETGRSPSQAQLDELNKQAKFYLTASGHPKPDALIQLLEKAKNEYSQISLKEIFEHIPSDFQSLLVADALRITYSQRPVDPEKKQLIYSMHRWMGEENHSLFALYDRGVMPDPRLRKDWLEELATTDAEPFANNPAKRSTRVYSAHEKARLDTECRGYVIYLEQIGILSPVQREVVLDRLMALDSLDIDVEQVKWVVLMVLFSQPGQESAFARMEDLVFEEVSGAVH